MKQTYAVTLMIFVLVYISIAYPLSIIYMFSMLTAYSFIDYNNKKNN